MCKVTLGLKQYLRSTRKSLAKSLSHVSELGAGGSLVLLDEDRLYAGRHHLLRALGHVCQHVPHV